MIGSLRTSAYFNCGMADRSRFGAIARRRSSAPILVTLAAAATALVAAQPAAARAPQGPTGTAITSTKGSGVFGAWTVDRFGLPAYDYRLDQEADARAAQPELDGDRANWSQLGNDAIVANAYNHGYTQLFSQAARPQWANAYDEESRNYAGGFGYLRVGGATASTLYLDRPQSSRMKRRFGAGYYEKRLRFDGLRIRQTTTAPFGSAPALVDEVKITNRSDQRLRASWWEYWGVNPVDVYADEQVGLSQPRFDRRSRTLSVEQASAAGDDDPLSIFLRAARPVHGFEADSSSFFGAGDRANPAAVAADRASGSLAPATAAGEVGSTMFAMRSPIKLAPGESVTLRYVYGIADREEIAAVGDAALRGRSSWRRGSERWAGWVPRIDLGSKLRWLARELTWDAYMVRSSSVEDEGCRERTITQGGYYQYGLGEQIAFRDPLQHVLPMIYADPALARDVLRYSLAEQAAGTGAIPYGIGPLCKPINVDVSNDMDFWLLWAVVEYVRATRDFGFLDERIPLRDSERRLSVWRHLKLAVDHQEAIGLGPHGNYNMGREGDWSDFSTMFLPASESTLVTAQLAWAYPQLAGLAARRGDDPFAARLGRLADRALATLRGEWTGGGWYSRGWYGDAQVGSGAIYLEPQPWALLAGAPSQDRARTLIANIERYLQGVGAPPELGGPTKIGTSQSPARNDPGVTEFDDVEGVGDNNAVFVGGAWYALNGPLTWALGELDGVVPGAERKAFSELKRNTLSAHAEAFPEHWGGILNVDDACSSFYATNPDRCGIKLLLDLGGTNGQVTHQPAWGLFAALKLAGIEATTGGYSFAPKLPRQRFSLRLPRVGITVAPQRMSGYVETESAGGIELRIEPPTRALLKRARVTVDGEPVRAHRRGGAIVIPVKVGRDNRVKWRIRSATGRR